MSAWVFLNDLLQGPVQKRLFVNSTTQVALLKKDVWSVNKSKKETKVINLKLKENLSTAHYSFSSKNRRLDHVSPVLTFSIPNIYFALKK